jgi:hypothetical protein
MYELVLSLHNIVRWAALILGIIAVVMAVLGWLGRREWTESNRRFGSFFAIAMDIQFLLGLILYFISPITRSALTNFGSAMGAPDVRLYALEHPLTMILAVVFAHLGSALPRRSADSTGKFKRAAILFAISVLLLLTGIPWDRPLFRLP